jgi:hypothetical protein
VHCGWQTEQAIEEMVNGNDLDHLVSARLHPNRAAVGFRLLARNLAIGLQIADAGARPAVIREPAAFRAAHVEGLGTFVGAGRTIHITPRRPPPARAYRLPWTRLTVRLAA